MASKSHKSKHYVYSYSFIFFFIAFLCFTFLIYLKQLIDVFQKPIAYYSDVTVPLWYGVVAQQLGDENMKVALVNMDGAMKKFHPGAEIVNVQFDPVREDIKWSDLFPEVIGEKDTKCPDVPMPKFEDYEQLDVVVARVNCTEGDGAHGLRDVYRLQLNLVVANLLVRSGSWKKFNRPVFAVFVGSSCGSMREIFTCDELVWSDGNYWVYRPNLSRIKEKMRMPVGSCQLVPPFSQSGEVLWRNQVSERARTYDFRFRQPREAYVTVLHSSEAYVCGAIALAQSIIASNSTKDLVLLADKYISTKSLKGLRAAGWKIRRIKRIRNPHAVKNAYNEWNYSKLRIWQLTDYDKVMFIDSDFIVSRNLDGFFIYPQLSAAENDMHIFNSGLMLVEPSKCTFEALMSKIDVVETYNGGDQGFLNEMFTWWHRLPAKVNHLKFFESSGDLVHQTPQDVYTLHYLGVKPWMCYRDYDCNWDKPASRLFASDSANKRWWQVYDAMPEKLRQFCSLSPELKARILLNRERSKKGKSRDRHWNIKIKDPRRLN